MEIKVGEYVRSKDGYVGKVEKLIYDKEYKQNYLICEKDNVMASNYTENIDKHSPNIIDLIECGDYVNGEKVVEVDSFKDWIDIGEDVLRENEVQSIVTKEQFNQMKYIVGDE